MERTMINRVVKRISVSPIYGDGTRENLYAKLTRSRTISIIIQILEIALRDHS